MKDEMQREARDGRRKLKMRESRAMRDKKKDRSLLQSETTCTTHAQQPPLKKQVIFSVNDAAD